MRFVAASEAGLLERDRRDLRLHGQKDSRGVFQGAGERRGRLAARGGGEFLRGSGTDVVSEDGRSGHALGNEGNGDRGRHFAGADDRDAVCFSAGCLFHGMNLKEN